MQIKRMLAAEYDYDTDIKPFENSLSRSVHPCTLLDASFCSGKNIAAAWNHRHPWRF